jgi:hypothetical protein
MGLFSRKPSPAEVKEAMRQATGKMAEGDLRKAVEAGDDEAAGRAIDELERKGFIHRDEHGIWQTGGD